MKIIIKGNANITMENHRRNEYFKNFEAIRQELTTFEFEEEILLPLETLSIEDSFVDYMDKSLSTKFKSGYTTFEVEEHKGRYYLYSICTYECKDDLTQKDFSKEEIDKLIRDTQGQWSDGIGEGFEQYPAFEYEDYEIFINCWVKDQKIQVEFKN